MGRRESVGSQHLLVIDVHTKPTLYVSSLMSTNFNLSNRCLSVPAKFIGWFILISHRQQASQENSLTDIQLASLIKFLLPHVDCRSPSQGVVIRFIHCFIFLKFDHPMVF